MSESLPKSIDDVEKSKETDVTSILSYDKVSPKQWLQIVDYDVSRLLLDAVHSIDPSMNSTFERLRKAMARILISTEMPKRVVAGQYGLVLGEDSTARIPTLFLSVVVKSISVASGNEVPIVRFYAGLRSKDSYINEDDEEIQDYDSLNEAWEDGMEKFIRKQETIIDGGKRALICTDTISSGGSLKNLIKILERNNIDFDIVTFGSDKTMSSLGGHDVFDGNLFGNDFNDDLRRNYAVSGVWKRPGDVHARSVRAYPPDKDVRNEHFAKRNATPIEMGVGIDHAMTEVRQIVKTLGVNMARAYLDVDVRDELLKENALKKQLLG